MEDKSFLGLSLNPVQSLSGFCQTVQSSKHQETSLCQLLLLAGCLPPLLSSLHCAADSLAAGLLCLAATVLWKLLHSHLDQKNFLLTNSKLMQRDVKERKRNQMANYQNSDPPVVFATVLKVNSYDLRPSWRHQNEQMNCAYWQQYITAAPCLLPQIILGSPAPDLAPLHHNKTTIRKRDYYSKPACLTTESSFDSPAMELFQVSIKHHIGREYRFCMATVIQC